MLRRGFAGFLIDILCDILAARGFSTARNRFGNGRTSLFVLFYYVEHRFSADIALLHDLCVLMTKVLRNIISGELSCIMLNNAVDFPTASLRIGKDNRRRLS